MRWPTAISPSLTTGVSVIEPIARIAAWGGLMIATNCSTSNMPRLLIVKVPPWYSCGSSPPLRARPARSFDRPRDRAETLLVGVGDERGDQAAFDRDGDVDVDIGVVVERVALKRGVEVRELAQRQRRRLDDQIVEGDLARVVRDLGVDLLAEAHRGVHVDFRRDVEVRNDLLGLGHALAGGLADPAHLAHDAGGAAIRGEGARRGVHRGPRAGWTRGRSGRCRRSRLRRPRPEPVCAPVR